MYGSHSFVQSSSCPRDINARRGSSPRRASRLRERVGRPSGGCLAGGSLDIFFGLVRCFRAVGSARATSKPLVHFILVPPHRIRAEDEGCWEQAIANIAPALDTTSADLIGEGLPASDDSSICHAKLHEAHRDFHGASWRILGLAGVKRHKPRRCGHEQRYVGGRRPCFFLLAWPRWPGWVFGKGLIARRQTA